MMTRLLALCNLYPLPLIFCYLRYCLGIMGKAKVHPDACDTALPLSSIHEMILQQNHLSLPSFFCSEISRLQDTGNLSSRNIAVQGDHRNESSGPAVKPD
ncbi:hypothetical protein N657DRAFT_49177 [Parathielavia appendiculata]|uniref:Uncharacterized protein n=1 Tax=Parathielavia appendiculata TaxID=2587402 RepID=A0AAN6U9K9_9PEZI|nr:hypothetical protein N657DRAFT_49177 [Parathielavia appendiculata]